MSDGRAYLPGVLGWIAEEVGREAAVQLARAYGGRSIYVPKNPRADCKLSKCVGQNAAMAISRKIGAGDLEIPQGAFRGPGARRRHIRDLVARGMTHSQIAEKLDVTERTVRNAVAEGRDDAQLDLPL